MMRNISRAVYIVSVVLLLLEHARANWPVVRYTNGTVGVTSDYGVHIETERTQVSGQFSVSGDLFVRDSNIVDRISKLEMQIPPICMPPGAEGLLFDGTSWICECAEYYFGTSCDIACQSNTTHYYNTTTSTCEENTASFITINGNTLYRDSEGWILLLAYNHKAGENNAFVSGTAPVSPTESYSHIWLEDLGLTEDDVDSVKFFCNTSAHARVIHFSVNNDMIKTAVITGTPTSNAASYWNTGTTKFSDHTGYLPDATTDASGADLTEAVFYKSNTYHWGMKIQGSRWECDDFSRNTANTLHQIWFKQKSTTSVVDPIEDFITARSPISYLDIEGHSDGELVFDIVLNTHWKNTGAIVTHQGKRCLDLSSKTLELSDGTTLGASYTQFYIWYPISTSKMWCALYRTDWDTLAKLYYGSLGGYFESGGRWKDSAYDVILQWQVLIVVSTGDSSSSNSGQTTFYINDPDDGSVKIAGTVSAKAIGPLKFIGIPGQEPGYFREAGLLNSALNDEEIAELMSILISKL